MNSLFERDLTVKHYKPSSGHSKNKSVSETSVSPSEHKYGNKDNKVPTPNLAYAYTQLQMLYPPFKVKVNMLLAFIYIILVL